MAVLNAEIGIYLLMHIEVRPSASSKVQAALLLAVQLALVVEDQ